MNIIVCVKQVPATTEVKINKETNTIIRENVESIINPFDLHAIEEGLRLKEKYGGKVIALSMGIPKAESMLKDVISLGVDEALLLSDKAFAGSDTLATAYVLSMAIRAFGDYDLIICGKQAIDGDTAQVGPSLAEKLNIPHTTYVKKIEDITNRYLTCQRLTDDGYEVIEMPLPALLTVVKEINEPRLPSIRNIMRAKKTDIKIWNKDHIHADQNFCGLKGSPTKVIRTFTPTHDIKNEFIEGSPSEQARMLVNRLKVVK